MQDEKRFCKKRRIVYKIRGTAPYFFVRNWKLVFCFIIMLFAQNYICKRIHIFACKLSYTHTYSHIRMQSYAYIFTQPHKKIRRSVSLPRILIQIIFRRSNNPLFRFEVRYSPKFSRSISRSSGRLIKTFRPPSRRPKPYSVRRL